MSRKASDEKDPFKIDVAWERELKHVFRRCCAQGSLAGLPLTIFLHLVPMCRVLADDVCMAKMED